MPLAAHTAGIGASDRASVSNFVFNQIGHFAASGGALAKSLFLGGVTARFPGLRVALLEGGAAVGVEIYVSLVSNWQKRGGAAIAGLDPENLDKELLAAAARRGRPDASPATRAEQLIGRRGRMTRVHDDFAAAKITSVEDIRDRFCTQLRLGLRGRRPARRARVRHPGQPARRRRAGVLRLRPRALGRARVRRAARGGLSSSSSTASSTATSCATSCS